MIERYKVTPKDNLSYQTSFLLDLIGFKDGKDFFKLEQTEQIPIPDGVNQITINFSFEINKDFQIVVNRLAQLINDSRNSKIKVAPLVSYKHKL